MDDNQLLRYARHLMLDDLGIEGQEQLLAAHVLIIGLGGLGSPAALYLASAGIGTITLVDDDAVELSNLQRQIAHSTDHIGLSKVASAKKTMLALNPDVTIHLIEKRLVGSELEQAIAQADVVLDCTDNFDTRQAINKACVHYKKPLVSGAAIRFDGQISVYDMRHPEAPCYACLFPPEERIAQDNCATMGVFSPLVGIIGSMQAAEAIKVIAGVGQTLSDRLLCLDAKSMHWQTFKTRKNPKCSVCG